MCLLILRVCWLPWEYVVKKFAWKVFMRDAAHAWVRLINYMQLFYTLVVLFNVSCLVRYTLWTTRTDGRIVLWRRKASTGVDLLQRCETIKHKHGEANENCLVEPMSSIRIVVLRGSKPCSSGILWARKIEHAPNPPGEPYNPFPTPPQLTPFRKSSEIGLWKVVLDRPVKSL